jgi:Virulence protein RhuM family
MVSREIDYYNLDVIISVGYRVNSKTATKFRQWATKTLKSHIVDGYTINPTRIEKNYEEFLKAVEDVKKLLPSGTDFGASDTLELIKLFAGTWFSLDAYDKSSLPKSGASKKQHISCTLLSRIIHLMMGTNAVVHLLLYGFFAGLEHLILRDFHLKLSQSLLFSLLRAIQKIRIGWWGWCYYC